MTFDADKLIRDAKPEVDPAMRSRVLDAARADGAAVLAAHRPGSLMILLRAAALVALALGAGVVAAVLRAPEPVGQPPRLAAESEQVEDLRRRIEMVEALPTSTSVVEELAAAQIRLDQFEIQRLEQALDTLVAERMEVREQREREQWRERHIAHVREHFAKEADATVERLREENGLTTAQEREVRALLSEHGKQAEALIGNCYKSGRHGNDVHSQFAVLADETEKKLNQLLDEQQQRGFEAEAVLGADPADWAPSADFEDASDVDAWTHWMTVSE